MAFTEKCVLAAQPSCAALVTTSDLFVAAKYLVDQSDDTHSDFAAAQRTASDNNRYTSQ